MPEPLPRPVAGPAVLPAGFGHPHASEEARKIAEEGMILRVQVGSGVHGTSVGGQDDRDEMGLCLEPPQFVTGLALVPNGVRGQGPSVRFEQYERHTAGDRPGGVANRSGAGDVDVIIYSARKWARLALAGNPTVLLVLFVPDEEVVFRNEAGAELVGNAHRFVSRLAAVRFLGYLRAQKAAMMGGASAHTNRPELVAVHGYDTKYAMHAVRLGLQGIELLTTGRITLPVPEPRRAYLRSIRQGDVPLADGLRVIGVDFSAVQLSRARLLVPAARLVQAHMTVLHLRRASLDAVVSYYALSHVPLAGQQALLPGIRSWLRPGGYLLAITGVQRWTGTEPYLGASMFWDHADTATYLDWLAAARPTPICHRYIPEKDSGHSLILARAS